jgi:hypothetical protein
MGHIIFGVVILGIDIPQEIKVLKALKDFRVMVVFKDLKVMMENQLLL